MNLREIRNFPIGLAQMDDAIKRRLSVLADELMADLKLHSQRKERNQKTTGLVIYDGFYLRHSKPIYGQNRLCVGQALQIHNRRVGLHHQLLHKITDGFKRAERMSEIKAKNTFANFVGSC